MTVAGHAVRPARRLGVFITFVVTFGCRHTAAELARKRANPARGRNVMPAVCPVEGMHTCPVLGKTHTLAGIHVHPSRTHERTRVHTHKHSTTLIHACENAHTLEPTHKHKRRTYTRTQAHTNT